MELLRRSGQSAPAVIADAADRDERWLEAMAGPDLKLPLLNDSWEGPPVRRRTEEALSVLRESGHVVMRHGLD